MKFGEEVMQNISDELPEVTTDSNIQNTVKYACLLHDIGHSPLSHVCEDFLDSPSELLQIINDKLDEDLPKLGDSPSHELMSCAVSLMYFKDKLINRDVDLDLFCRMITGIIFNENSSKKDLNFLISLLNGWMDVDKLDYIIRDNIMSGANLVNIDKNRIIRSYKCINNVLSLSKSGLSVVSSLVFGREALYLWGYTHFRTYYYHELIQRYIKYLIKRNEINREELFSLSSFENGEIDDHTIYQIFKEKKEINDYSKNMFTQIFSRKYFKALWKTPFEFYSTFGDAIQRVKIKNLIEREVDDSVIPKNHLELMLEKQFNEENKFFTFVTKFKPFSESESLKDNIFIDIAGESRRFSEIFSPSIYKQSKEIITKVPYVFIDESLVSVKKDIINYLKTTSF